MRYDAINPGPSVTPDVLDAYCREHGLRLPEPLREQLLDQNGGAFRSDTCVGVGDGSREEEVMSLLGVHMSDSSAELAWVIKTFDGRVPPGSIPFADDPVGNLFLLDEGGRVLFWDHEREMESDAAEIVADSLAGFLGKLRTQ